MIVHKVIPLVNPLPKEGDELKIVPAVFNGREDIEKVLEDFRLMGDFNEKSRSVGSFVFPHREDIIDIAFEYASKYAGVPGMSCQVILLDIQIDDNIVWHNHDIYNDLYFEMKKNVRDEGKINKLIQDYWSPVSPTECKYPEGLITQGIILKVSNCLVTHNGLSIVQ